MLLDLIKENGSMPWNSRIKWYSTEMKADADNTDFLALLVNIPAQAQSLFYSLELAARGIDFLGNANKTEFVSFKQGIISTLNAKPLKLVDKFTYLGNNISSTESDINIYLLKVWTAIYRLSITWKCVLFNEIKWDFFLAVVGSFDIAWIHHMDMNEVHVKKARWDLIENVMCCF